MVHSKFSLNKKKKKELDFCLKSCYLHHHDAQPEKISFSDLKY